MASPETGEITANQGGDSAELQSFDQWLSYRFPAARTAWIHCSSLKLQMNGGQKWENWPRRARGSGWIRFRFSSLSSLLSFLFLSLSIYNGGQQGQNRVWGITIIHCKHKLIGINCERCVSQLKAAAWLPGSVNASHAVKRMAKNSGNQC